jgi:hypothetical protein
MYGKKPRRPQKSAAEQRRYLFLVRSAFPMGGTYFLFIAKSYWAG